MQVLRIELPSITGMRSVNAYVVEDQGLTLVDAGEGTEESYVALVAGLKSHGWVVGDLDEILITHAHVDHIGGASRIAQEANIKVKVSDLVRPWTSGIKERWSSREDIIRSTLDGLMPPGMSQLATGMYGQLRDLMLSIWQDIPNELLVEYDILDPHIDISGSQWKMLYVPGHSSSQNCFYHEPSRQLLSADMILRITPTPVLEPSVKDKSVREKSIIQLLESYELIKCLEVDRVYPGHYDIIDDCHPLIESQVERIHRRKDETMRSIVNGNCNITEIYQDVYKGRVDLPAFNMLLGYLDLLEDEDKIKYHFNGTYKEIKAKI